MKPLRFPFPSGFPLSAALAAAFFFSPSAPTAFCAELSSAQFRKFRGTYSGGVSGVAGNATAGTASVGPFETRIRVRGRRSEQLRPLISSLFTAEQHRIEWARATGSRTRARLVGTYRGTFTNSEGARVRVSGSRRLTLTHRQGAASGRRFVARMQETLTETFDVTGAVSANQRLRGTLRR
jgi:hypothetical protein